MKFVSKLMDEPGGSSYCIASWLAGYTVRLNFVSHWSLVRTNSKKRNAFEIPGKVPVGLSGSSFVVSVAKVDFIWFELLLHAAKARPVL
jgi:hypothetical protein